MSFYGYDAADAPLVTLAGDGAGVNGLRFDYPLSAPEKEKEVRLASSPCIAIKAEGNYVVNSFVNLASVGVRCENAKNVFLKLKPNSNVQNNSVGKNVLQNFLSLLKKIVCLSLGKG